MRSGFSFSRFCGCRNKTLFNILVATPRSQQSFSRWTRNKYSLKDPRQRLQGSRILFSAVAAAATLTPAAFVKLSEEENGDGKTGELHMLEASRQEISKEIPDDVHGVTRVFKTIIYVLDQYIYEPIATGLRFLHLVIIFVPVIVTIPAVWLGPRRKDQDNERAGTIWWYGFLVSAMEQAGPAFIKLGQWAASRSDIFPGEMCRVMSELHSNAPAHSLRHTKKTITHAFGGRNFDDIFEEFQENPLGVGAIAQVYKARLKADIGQPDDSDLDQEEAQKFRQRLRKNVDAFVKSSPQRVPSTYVAIKVLHPKVERIVRRDLKIMAVFASIINAIPTLEWLDLPNEVTNFGEMMRLQLDLRIESANLTIFRKNFQHRTTAWFPYPYTDYTTRQVLVEEFAQGIPLAAFLESADNHDKNNSSSTTEGEANTSRGIFEEEIANEGLDAFLHMLLIDNFVHADLHPGNIMVRFYKPHQPSVPFFLRSFFPSSTPSPATQSSSEQDETEQILSRLRPHRHNPQKWTETLTQIDSEGYRPQLIFIDTGLVTELNAKNRTNFLSLFRAVAEFDGYKAGHLMISRSRTPESVLDPEIFALKMQHLVLAVKSRTFALGNVKIGDILHQVLSMVRTHHVRMEGDFVNVVISILLLEGIGRKLDPQLDLFKSALPILRRQIAVSATTGGTGDAKMTAGLESEEGESKTGQILSLLKIWLGLEARRFVQASAESVERCVKYDLLSPNI